MKYTLPRKKKKSQHVNIIATAPRYNTLIIALHTTSLHYTLLDTTCTHL